MEWTTDVDEGVTAGSIAAVWFAVLFSMGMICGSPSGGGGPTGNCKQKVAESPSEVETGDLKVTLGRVEVEEDRAQTLGPGDADTRGDSADLGGDSAVDSSVPGDLSSGDVADDVSDVSDGGVDTGREASDTSDGGSSEEDSGGSGDTSVPRADTDPVDGGSDGGAGSGENSDVRFVSLGDPPKFAIEHGFQGGFHFSPAVLVEEVGASDFSSTVRFEVRDGSNGDVLTHRACSQTAAASWFEQGDGYVFNKLRVVFDAELERVVGHTHTVVADVEVEDERKVLQRDVKFVESR